MQISQAPSPKIRLNSLSMLPPSFPMIVVILKLGQTEQLTHQVKQSSWPARSNSWHDVTTNQLMTKQEMGGKTWFQINIFQMVNTSRVTKILISFFIFGAINFIHLISLIIKANGANNKIIGEAKMNRKTTQKPFQMSKPSSGLILPLHLTWKCCFTFFIQCQQKLDLQNWQVIM